MQTVASLTKQLEAKQKEVALFQEKYKIRFKVRPAMWHGVARPLAATCGLEVSLRWQLPLQSSGCAVTRGGEGLSKVLSEAGEALMPS